MMQKSERHFLAQRGAPPVHVQHKVWLSILIPVYNVESYVSECLQSISSQMQDGVEAVLVDDNSTDGSMALCERFCEYSEGQFRLFAHAVNKGVGVTRNALLAAAKGEYIWYVDPDDRILPGSIRRLRELTLTHAPDVVMCDYMKKNRRHSSFAGAPDVLRHDNPDLIRGVFANRRMHLWSKVFRRSLWGEDLRFPDVRCFEDVAVTPWLLLRARSYYYAPEPWVFYRVRRGSLTGLVSRTAGKFDDQKNDDLALALEGYAAAVINSRPDVDQETLFAIAHFCGKEFTKISARILSARLGRDDWRCIRERLRRYRVMMEGSSPISFDALLKAYLSRHQFGKWLILRLSIFFSRPW